MPTRLPAVWGSLREQPRQRLCGLQSQICLLRGSLQEKSAGLPYLLGLFWKAGPIPTNPAGLTHVA